MNHDMFGLVLRGAATGALLMSCSGADTPPQAAEQAGASESVWTPIERTYPYIGKGGETICAEWTSISDTGIPLTDSEWYFVDRMNEQLADTQGLNEGIRSAMAAKGLTRVQSCEDARQFIRIKREYLDSQPSEEPAAEAQGPERLEGDVPGEQIDKIRQGYTYDHLPHVRLYNWDTGKVCSAFLINKNTLITAAHCFPLSFPGGVRVSIDYGDVYAPGWCISNNTPNCWTVVPSSSNITAVPNNFYTGLGDFDDDIAVAYIGGPLPNNTSWPIIGNDPNFFLRLTATAPGQATSFAMHGYGANAHSGAGAGIGRRSNGVEGISFAGPHHWYAFATQGFGHPCAGDSGSAAVNFDKIPYDLAIGVFSSYERASGTTNLCPQIGDKFWYTGISSKISFIESIIGSCNAFSSGGWAYRRCW
jgi:hypothetical protein